MSNGVRQTRAFWICAVVALISALVSASFSLAALQGKGNGDVYAMYAASRSVALPIVVVMVMWLRWRLGVAAMALTMALVQVFDGVIGATMHDPFETYGPWFFALLGFASVAMLLRDRRDA
jgi:hypothetical protein